LALNLWYRISDGTLTRQSKNEERKGVSIIKDKQRDKDKD